MSKVFGTARLALTGLLILASSSAARGDAATRSRVTIRGSGSNITIEQTQSAGRMPVFERKATSPDALGEAVRLKTEGVSDGGVLAYLRAHGAELPSIIDAGAVTRLRRAGAGKSVVAYLATVAAVEIGATGEGRAPADSYASVPDAEAEMPAYDASSGYPFYGGYAPAYPARSHRAAFSPHRGPLPRRQPALHGAFPSRAMPGRRRME